MNKLDQMPKDENGLAHGEWLAYSQNNVLHTRGNYVHGIPHGLWESYHLDGKLMMKSNCHMGLNHGVSERYSNGKLAGVFVDQMDKNLLFVIQSYKALSLSL